MQVMSANCSRRQKNLLLTNHLLTSHLLQEKAPGRIDVRREVWLGTSVFLDDIDAQFDRVFPFCFTGQALSQSRQSSRVPYTELDHLHRECTD